MLGDVNGNGTIDLFDLMITAQAFTSTPRDHNWNPNVDLTKDGIIDLFDLLVMARHFLETCLP